MARSSHYTTDHDRIREWVEERGGRPTAVRRTSRRGTGILRIDFPGYSGEKSLEPISWDEFFDKFDDQNLVFLFQERTARGQKSNFNKLVRVSDDMLDENGGAEGERGAGSRRGGGSRGRGGRAGSGGSRGGTRARSRGGAERREPVETASRGARSTRGGASRTRGAGSRSGGSRSGTPGAGSRRGSASRAGRRGSGSR
jgi:hypothetical protein